MADVIDKANDAAGVILSSLISTQAKPIKPFVNYSQTCLNCGEPVETTAHKFCCPECCNDWQARKQAEERNYGRRS